LSLTVERVDFGAVEDEWRELHNSCDPAYPFLSPTWHRTWWEEFADGREPVLLRVSEEGKTRAFVPLMRDGGALTFAGDTSICDYMDVVSSGGDRMAMLDAVLRSLGEEPWDTLELWALRGDSPTYAALGAVCERLGSDWQREVEDVCPQIELPGDWEEYLAGLDKKDRHELRRKLRKLSQGGEPELEVLTAEEDVTAALDDFVRQHKSSRSDKETFMTEQMERFFRRVVPALAAEGRVEMIFLRLGGVRAACVLCFRTDGDILLYNSGYEPAYAGLSVGLLSKALALKRAIELGLKRFDFLRGAEPYKYDLGAVDVPVYRCAVRRQ
jgi:CelD/BcsL family acetyltransferase involved in cellulose biosynthesis